jgi:hypothetical protein
VPVTAWPNVFRLEGANVSINSKLASSKAIWIGLALVLIPVLCCAAPLLLGVGVVGVVSETAAASTNLLVGGVVALVGVAVVVVWQLRRRMRAIRLPRDQGGCCAFTMPLVSEDASEPTHAVDR